MKSIKSIAVIAMLAITAFTRKDLTETQARPVDHKDIKVQSTAFMAKSPVSVEEEAEEMILNLTTSIKESMDPALEVDLPEEEVNTVIIEEEAEESPVAEVAMDIPYEHANIYIGVDDNRDELLGRTLTILQYIPYNLKTKYFEDGNVIYVMPKDEVSAASNGSIAYLSTTDYNGMESYEIYLSCESDHIEQSLAHEMGHYMDHICGTPSNNAQFIDLMLTEGVNAGLDDYYTTNPDEYFAEIFNQMIMDPTGYIVSVCPESVAFVKMYVDLF